jgi:hypothetical protein
MQNGERRHTRCRPTVRRLDFEFVFLLGWSGDMWCWANGWGVDCALESIQDMHCISIRKTQIYLTRLNDRE